MLVVRRAESKIPIISWLGELIQGDPAEELVRQGKGFTIVDRRMKPWNPPDQCSRETTGKLTNEDLRM